MHENLLPELHADDSAAAVGQRNLLIREAEIQAHGLHLERGVEIPIGAIRIAAIGNRQRDVAHHRVRIQKNIEEAHAFFCSNGLCENCGVGLRAARDEVEVIVELDHAYAALFASGGGQRPHLRKRKIGNLVGVFIQRLA